MGVAVDFSGGWYPARMQSASWLHLAVVVLATMLGLALCGWTVTARRRADAEDEAVVAMARVGVLERILRARSRSLRALADLIAGR